MYVVQKKKKKTVSINLVKKKYELYVIVISYTIEKFSNSSFMAYNIFYILLVKMMVNACFF
jgi:hypothetical protein